LPLPATERAILHDFACSKNSSPGLSPDSEEEKLLRGGASFSRSKLEIQRVSEIMKTLTFLLRAAWLCAALLGLQLSVPRLVSAGAQPALRVLFLGDNGHHHPAERFKQMQPALASRQIELNYSDSLEDLNPGKLPGFDCVLIYDSSRTNNTISTHTFGSQTVTAGTFTITMPTNDASNALVRIA
jgi:hypothetical protein